MWWRFPDDGSRITESKWSWVGHGKTTGQRYAQNYKLVVTDNSGQQRWLDDGKQIAGGVSHRSVKDRTAWRNLGEAYTSRSRGEEQESCTDRALGSKYFGVCRAQKNNVSGLPRYQKVRATKKSERRSKPCRKEKLIMPQTRPLQESTVMNTTKTKIPGSIPRSFENIPKILYLHDVTDFLRYVKTTPAAAKERDDNRIGNKKEQHRGKTRRVADGWSPFFTRNILLKRQCPCTSMGETLLKEAKTNMRAVIKVFISWPFSPLTRNKKLLRNKIIYSCVWNSRTDKIHA